MVEHLIGTFWLDFIVDWQLINVFLPLKGLIVKKRENHLLFLNTKPTNLTLYLK